MDFFLFQNFFYQLVFESEQYHDFYKRKTKNAIKLS